MATARVLVVDDDATILNAVSRILKQEGYEVLSAEQPRHALEIVATSPPIDLVVSDIVMPEMDGSQLVREVTELSPQTTSVLMTGGILNATHLPLGVPVLKKPFTRQNLLSTVQQCLERSAQARADLRCGVEKSIQQRRQSKQLRADTDEAIRQANDILEELRFRDKGFRSE